MAASVTTLPIAKVALLIAAEFNVLRSSFDPRSGVVSTRRLIVGSKRHHLRDATKADGPGGMVGRNSDRHNAIGRIASAGWLFKVSAIASHATWIAYPGVMCRD